MIERGSLERELSFVDPTYGIIRGLAIYTTPPGEPHIHLVSVDRMPVASLTDGGPVESSEGGCALERHQAIGAAIGEAVERYSASIYHQETLHQGSYSDLKQEALNPADVVAFTIQQRQTKEIEQYSRTDSLYWVKGTRLDREGSVWVPAQLVYLSYQIDSEPILRYPISTGLAAGTDTAATRCRAALEVIERDAAIIYYLNQTELPKLRLDTDHGRLKKLKERLESADLQYHLFDARTDIGVPIVIAVLIDRNREPAVSVGTAAAINVVDAAGDAITEALQTRTYQITLLDEPMPDMTDYGAIGMDERMRLWADQEMIDHLDFWLESSRKTPLSAIRDHGPTNWSVVLDEFRKKDMSVYAADVTTRDVAQGGYTVQRIIIPGLQPLYLNERNRYWGGSRLREVPSTMGYDKTPASTESFYVTPHPFP